jgi:hypothetical protein
MSTIQDNNINYLTPEEPMEHHNGKVGDCEVCDAKGVRIRPLHSRNMWFCDSCYEIEIQAQVDSVKTRLTEINPVQSAISQAAKIDSSIQVRTDLFNAATTAIVELKKTIDEDASIVNKPYALAEALMARFSHFKQVVFELNQQIVDAGNQQKAIQVYLNGLANSLRAEEREKLKIADINYKPGPAKIVKPPANKPKKLDKAELRKYATEIGVSEFTLQMLVVQKGISVADAAKLLQQSVNRAKAGL